METKNNIIIGLLIIIVSFLTLTTFLPHVDEAAREYVEVEVEGYFPEGVRLPIRAVHGQMDYVEGEVEMRTSQEDGWRSLEGGEVVRVGNEVRTLTSSRAVITFEDGSVARLSESSQMRVESTRGGVHIAFTRGGIFNKVVSSTSRTYRISVDGSEVRALGTAFTVEKDVDAPARVSVIESTVEISGIDGDVIGTVEEGKKSVIPVDGQKIVKEDVTKEDLEKPLVKWAIEREQIESETIKKFEDRTDDSSNNRAGGEKDENPLSSDDSDETTEKSSAISLSGKQTDNGVKLEWSGSDAPKGFKVVRDTGKSPTYPAHKSAYVGDGDARSYHWETTAGKLYHFRICMWNGADGCYNYSNTVSVEAPKGGSSKDDKDEKKKDDGDEDYADKVSLSADEGDGKVELKWELSGGGAPNGFKILKDTDKNPKYPDDSVAYVGDADARSYTIKGLKDDKEYHFRVCIYNGDGCEVYSDDEEVEL